MKSQTSLLSVSLLVVLMFLTTSCLQGGFKTISSGSFEGGGSVCPLKPKAESVNASVDVSTASSLANNYVNVFAEKNEKLFEADFISPSQNENIKILNSEIHLNAGMQIILQVERNCVLNSTKIDALSASVKNQIHKVTKPGSSSLGYYSFSLKKSMPLSELKALAEADECVVGAAPNDSLELQAAPNDPLYASQNNMVAIHHDALYTRILNEIQDEVLVAVVDSGNDQKSPDMQGRHWKNMTEFSGQAGIDDDGNGFVDDIYGYSWACYIGGDRPTSFWFIPHGEHVSGIIAANINNGTGIGGIAGQKAKVMHLNVIYSGQAAMPCNGTQEDLVLAIQAIQYAADNGAKVINLSMGQFSRNSMMEDVIKYAVSKGAFMASAAGNNNRGIDNNNNFFYPCGYSKDLDGFSCVGAVDSNPSNLNARCGFSNFSAEHVELAAPGCDSTVGSPEGSYGSDGILSTVRVTETPVYKYIPGTSMATPHIAGAAAVVMGYMKSKTGTWPTPAQVEDILKKGSKNIQSLESVFQNGQTLDMGSLFLYMDSLLGVTPPEC